jgi:hypothetical protein
MTLNNRQEYHGRLQAAIQQLHECGSVWRQTVPAHEVFRGKTVWQGELEVFEITGHFKAKRGYAWSHREGENDQGERFVAVLELPPAGDARSAVQVATVSDSRG